MSSARLTAILLLIGSIGFSPTHDLHAATFSYLTPFGSSYGEVYGIDGQNIVGMTLGQTGFLYDGTSYTQIQPPGGFSTAAMGISGNRIVGYSGGRGFLFDATSYTFLSDPLAVKGTVARGIDGNLVVGWYNDSANKPHGFLYDINSQTWTTLDNPLGVQGTQLTGISGNTIVGTYVDSRNRSHGFSYNGSSFSVLNDTFTGSSGGIGITPYGVDGKNIVGAATSAFPYGFLYDGSSFSHPLGQTTFTGISGNRIIGVDRDLVTNLDKPYLYVIPEPSSSALTVAGALALVTLRLLRRRKTTRTIDESTGRLPGG